VPQFVEENEDAQNDHEREKIIDEKCHGTSY
jgi:hypothetical protein